MESLMRIGVFLVFGGILLLANIWFVRQAFESFFRPGLVIAPFELVGQSGDAGTGKTLAYLLQARLQQVLGDLERAQNSLRNTPPGPAGQARLEIEKPDSGGPPQPPVPAFWQPIRLNTTLFSPVDMKVAVGGVEVGSVLPWIQRAIVKRDMLTFTVSYEAGKAVIAGDISALHAGTASVWTETAAATPTNIADLLAHEIIRRKLATDSNSRIGALDAAEFQTLSNTLLATARLNSRIAQGRIVREDFAQLVPGVEGLVQKVPDWSDLLFLAGTIAENAGADDKAQPVLCKAGWWSCTENTMHKRASRISHQSWKLNLRSCDPRSRRASWRDWGARW